jgi:hypothetical protein
MEGDESTNRMSSWLSPKAQTMLLRQGNRPVGTGVLDQDGTLLDLHQKYSGGGWQCFLCTKMLEHHIYQ